MLAMPETPLRSRPSTQLSTGTKVCLIIAAVFLVSALYNLVVPINIPATQGVFGCGSAMQPPTDPFAVGVCQDLAVIQQIRAGALAVAALAVAALGFIFFGATRIARPAHGHEIDPAADDAGEGH